LTRPIEGTRPIRSRNNEKKEEEKRE